MQKERSWSSKAFGRVLGEVRAIEAAAIMLFTFQAARVLFAMLFARVYDTLFDGEGLPALILAGVLSVVMLLVPLLSPKDPRKVASSMRISAILCALARIPLSIDNPGLRLVAAIATIAFSGLYVAGLLRTCAGILAAALSLGLFADQFLRAVGHTYDLSLRGWWLVVQIIISLGVISLATRRARGERPIAAQDRAGFWGGLSYGGALFLFASLLALPNAAARWTGDSYAVMVASMMALTTLPIWPEVSRWMAQGMFGIKASWLRAAALLLVLIGLLLADRGMPAISTIAMIATIAATWLLLPQSLSAGSRGVKGGLVVGMSLFILLAVAHAFSYTYAYTLAQFQGAGLPTFLVAAVLAVGPALLPRQSETRGGSPDPLSLPTAGSIHRPWSALCPPGRIMGLALWLAACLLAFPWPPKLVPTTDALRYGTYNIHYGFDTHWHLSLEEQARTIEGSGAEIVALQEVDTGRLTSFGVDNALWLARRLGMRAVYLPTVEHTTGIALLSRLPIIESEGILLPSEEEPTGIIRATVSVGGEPVKAHAIWLGLSPDERTLQIDAALVFIGQGRATLAGDMNSTPDSPIYATMLAHGFADPFSIVGSAAPTSPSESPQERIDYVWLRGLEPTKAHVLDSIASDHRMVVVEAR